MTMLANQMKAAVLSVLQAKGLRNQARTLRVVETLSLGGRKQLHLVSCAGKTFLVGGGADAVQCIVAVEPEGADGGPVQV